MDEGNIIFLNGASSSGKTSIARAVQEISNNPYLYLGLDELYCSLIPRKYLHDDPYIYFGSPALEADMGNHRLPEDLFGQLMAQVFPGFMKGFHASFSTFASRGNNVIVDHVLQEPSWLLNCLGELRNNRVFFIGVKCDVSVLQQRERARGDRIVGMAAYQSARLHDFILYDLEVDTTTRNPDDCANEILRFVDAQVRPTALRRMLDASLVPGVARYDQENP